MADRLASRFRGWFRSTTAHRPPRPRAALPPPAPASPPGENDAQAEPSTTSNDVFCSLVWDTLYYEMVEMIPLTSYARDQTMKNPRNGLTDVLARHQQQWTRWAAHPEQQKRAARLLLEWLEHDIKAEVLSSMSDHAQRYCDALEEMLEHYNALFEQLLRKRIRESRGGKRDHLAELWPQYRAFLRGEAPVL
jgi:hypothetical protein